MITDEQKRNDLLAQIAGREAEIYSYQTNINNYAAMLTILPKEWREDLVQFKGMTSEEIVKNVPDVNMQLVSDLVFRDRIEITLKIEQLEQSKAVHVLNALKSQLR